MEKTVLLCGYSYHLQRVKRGDKRFGLDSYLLRLQTEGTSRAEIEGEDVKMEPGDLILLKPGSSYQLEVDTTNGSGDYYLFCHGEWMDEWWSRYPKPIKSRIKIGEAVLHPWRQIIKETRRLNEENQELTDYLLRVLCLSIDRAVTDTSASYSRAVTALKMKQYIEEHAHQAFKVEDVARHACLSVSRASHFFKECYGKTMVEYALEYRLATALERMRHTGMSMESIAESCGFGSYTYFHRVFKSKFGLSPSHFRKLEKSFR
ncbi:AraC family transcriptional regulator [Paenibacillus sp. OAS669]|uniref:AraC family transcriptional regulator n=1 Tax=Paenibacillus sp. OAS669 TaxID=2663821 RepID=UPI00178B8265|nr:AraC family transcriptional regulator [Paenibacillus sp. OAS669]MBE1444402.1 AraC family transcriptional regulator of arabinose operon [Paenibacillus sp. OAS669]